MYISPSMRAPMTLSTYGIFARGRTETKEAEILMMLRRGIDGMAFLDFPGGVIGQASGDEKIFVEMLRTADTLCGSSESKRPFKTQMTTIGNVELRLPLSVAKTSSPPKTFRLNESQLVYLFFPMLLTPNEGKYWTPRARAAVRRNVNEKLGQHGFVWLSISYIRDTLRRSSYLENFPVSRWVQLFFAREKDWLSETLFDQYIKRQHSNGIAVLSTFRGGADRDSISKDTNSKEKSASLGSEDDNHDEKKKKKKKKKGKSPYSPLRARAPTFEYIPNGTKSSKPSETTETRRKPLSWTRDIVSGVKIVSWNLLCDGKNYALSGHHGYCSDEYLSWKQHRGPMVIDRLSRLDADIMCLQEVNARMLNDIMHALSSKGYVLAGFRLKDMNDMWGTCINYDDSFGYPMGVATVVKAQTIHVEGVTTVNLRDSFGDYVRENDRNSFLPFPQYVTQAHLLGKFHPDPAINMLMKRNDCAVFTKLKHVKSSTKLLVANTHLYWNPQPPGVKSIQAFLTHYAMLRFGSECSPKYDASNICICGDLNSDIFSPGKHDGAIMLLSDGMLSISHPEHPCNSSSTKRGWRDMILTGGALRSAHESLLMHSEKPNTIQRSRKGSKLSPHSSVYVPGSPGKSEEGKKKKFNTLSLVTTRVPTYEGWIDHIFISRSHLCVLDVLSLPYTKNNGKTFGPIPNKEWPSDHIVIGAVLGGGNLSDEDDLVQRKWSGVSETVSETTTVSRGRVSSFSSFEEEMNGRRATLVRNRDVDDDNDDDDDDEDDDVTKAQSAEERKASEGQSLLGRLMRDQGLSPLSRPRRAHSAPSYGYKAMTPEEAKERLSSSKVASEILSLFRRAIESD